jgi:hypothetical protein
MDSLRRTSAKEGKNSEITRQSDGLRLQRHFAHRLLNKKLKTINGKTIINLLIRQT